MKDIERLEEPGVDNTLIDILRAWGIVEITQTQTMALVAGVANEADLMICAPTSSGKTLVGEIAVIQAIRRNHRSIYLVSHKALADQKFDDFIEKFAKEDSPLPATVGLSTGDREEGDLKADVLIATYEKALSLVLSEQVDPTQCTLIADELQILGDETRGPYIEILCTILKQRGTNQFVALAATIENPNEIADWIGCKLVRSDLREVPLDQQIWHMGSGHSLEFGQVSGQDIEGNALPSDAIGAAKYLLEEKLGPVLVFVESRPEASSHAAEFSRMRQITRPGVGLVEQLDLFTEPSERSTNLRQSTERGVAFHSADLTPSERQIIENGFSSDSFDICFATSTLAAGVNFPFRTVVFPKLTYEYGPREGTRINRNDYRNMSGRAGRLGMHERGLAVLLSQDQAELRHANQLVLSENDSVFSRLSELSMRQAVLVLVSAGIADTEQHIFDFFESTYYWHLTLERNPVKLDDVKTDSLLAFNWLIDAELIENHEATFLPTPLGQATARSGLLPQTATEFVKLVGNYVEFLDGRFDESIPALIHWLCSSEEFVGDVPSRFLPFPSGGQTPGSFAYVSGHRLFRELDRTDNRIYQNVHALLLFVQGIGERHINRYTNITSGNVHRLAMDVSWMLDGLHAITAVPQLGCPQSVSNKIAILSRRMRWGAPSNALDLIRIANRARVPGLGRQRAMSLVEAGIVDFDDVAQAGLGRLEEILGSRRRAEALLGAVSEYSEVTSDRLNAIHRSLGTKIGLASEIARCFDAIGTDYEDAIIELLRKNNSWNITVIDDGNRKNVPDVLLEVGERSVLIEMKTSSKRSGLIKKDEAFAVIQKAMNFDKEIKRATLGKPYFDELSKEKAVASVEEVTLVEHSCFMECVLRVLCGNISADDFMDWISQPGLAEFARIPGRRTDLLI